MNDSVAEPAVPEPDGTQPTVPRSGGSPAGVGPATQVGHDLEVDIAAFLPDGVEVATDGSAEPTGIGATEPEPDPGPDLAPVSDEDAIDLDLLGRLEADLDSVDQALKAIDGGTYGVCAACGTDLDPAILQDDPVRTLCEAHLPVR